FSARSHISCSNAPQSVRNMTHQEFDVLVRQVESGVGRDPDKLRKKVTWLAFIGFAGILLPLGLVLLFAAAFFLPQVFWAPEAWGLSVVAALILLFGGWLALRPLFVRLPPPKGRKVKRAEVPALFATLDDLGNNCTQLDSTTSFSSTNVMQPSRKDRDWVSSVGIETTF
ncbi:MAG: hypothetical protein JWO95_2414, partial [Verrucomicrobiales bacterium]|nr:hypothetical protein [Verrucomicrobiales bacterium]